MITLTVWILCRASIHTLPSEYAYSAPSMHTRSVWILGVTYMYTITGVSGFRCLDCKTQFKPTDRRFNHLKLSAPCVLFPRLQNPGHRSQSWSHRRPSGVTQCPKDKARVEQRSDPIPTTVNNDERPVPGLRRGISVRADPRDSCFAHLTPTILPCVILGDGLEQTLHWKHVGEG